MTGRRKRRGISARDDTARLPRCDHIACKSKMLIICLNPVELAEHHRKVMLADRRNFESLLYCSFPDYEFRSFLSRLPLEFSYATQE